ncbi:snare-complex protein syntaxin-18 N-terminus-domain-containing protein [Aspergillus caelatus]|uniref:Snare-complex protein syntaxin-18 N-terminus-domain-containing protein n=2 Tax=Aspergillus subgen. Circumdati TaxID=2720871 RepID=A0A5N7A5R0_9EURO|nr:snare-complex protein syntaxin-18 N-terminus-domain-containing protein [Aspergillus caelatus]KAE8365201.1 snare-complex protein syntaxin-18 N-terminus-domain-containing protein [Aspergillus caelatus]KAE8414272.1 snare-complex protein syntaxin-18 N-terminus-domain-containing protein [Aspergillus pseudocaelatus]
MTDLTPTLNAILLERQSPPIPIKTYNKASPADEFLKEAYRINKHITNLTTYLQKIRPQYLSLTKAPRHKPSSPKLRNAKSGEEEAASPLSDTDRDQIDTSTSLVLHDLSNSISTLSSAETLRHETATSILRKKYGRSVAGRVLAKWASGSGALGDGDSEEGKSEEQVREEEGVRVLQVVRGSVIWFLRRGLEDVVSLQRGLVERRIERVSERERSVLFKGGSGGSNTRISAVGDNGANSGAGGAFGVDDTVGLKGAGMDESEVRAIEEELSAEQLQLFEAENDAMVRYYEDTLSKVQNAEKSLLEISSLQQTLVSHLGTQEEYISQLVTDAASTQTNIGRGNKELKRASERRSAAQAVFWGTVGLCTSLIVWDLIF